MVAVMARRRSESMFILQTALLGSLTELVLGHADGAGHIAAVLVYLIDKVLGDGGSAVQDYREAGQVLLNGLKHVEAELRLRAGLELVCAVAGADGDGQGVARRCASTNSWTSSGRV